MTARRTQGGRRIVVVTGMSGAGKSTALRAFEDLGYETVDNLPLAMLEAVMSSEMPGRPVAVGIDVRTRDFDAALLLAALDELRRRKGYPIGMVFLDSDSEVLGRRYTETRRPHPLADDLPVAVGIEMERRLLGPLREGAEMLLDTSHLTAAELKRILSDHYGGADQRRMRVFLTSFGYRHGLPRDADLVFDVRFLKNPHYVDALRPHTGLDTDVGAYIAADPALATFLDRATALLEPLLPLYEGEGKSYLTIAVGCTGGKHRSVYVVERLKDWLAGHGRSIDVRHRDLPVRSEKHP